MCDKNTVPSVSAISRLLRGREEEIKKPRGKLKNDPPKVPQTKTFSPVPMAKDFNINSIGSLDLA